MTLRVQIMLRLLVEDAKRIKDQAERENRSVNNLMETIIREYLDKKEKEAK